MSKEKGEFDVNQFRQQRLAEIKTFLKNARKGQQESGDQVQIFEVGNGEVVSKGNSHKIEQISFRNPPKSEDEAKSQSYIEIRCAENIPLYIPKDTACYSGWIQRLFEENNGTFKENIEKAISFPKFSTESVELVFQWITEDIRINGPLATQDASKIIYFQFSLPGNLVMEILLVSDFLEVIRLTERCIMMLSHNLDDLSLLLDLTPDLITKVLRKVPINKLAEFQMSDASKNMDTEMTRLWLEAFKNRGWVADHQPYSFSWTPFVDVARYCSYVNCNNGDTTLGPNELMVRYLERDIQEKVLTALTESDVNSIMAPYATCTSSILHHTLQSTFPLGEVVNYLQSFPNLTFLEISGINLTTQGLIDALSDYLANRTTSITSLKLSQCLISDTAQISKILDNPKLALKNLDLQENKINEKGMGALAKYLQGNESLTALSLAGNRLLSRGFLELVSALASSKVEILDVSNNGITFSDANKTLALKMTKLSVLILSENPLVKKPYYFKFNVATMDMVDSQAIDQLFEFLPDSLTALDLSRCDLGDKEIKRMCDFMIQKPMSLATLDLSSNNFRDAGLACIAEVLKANKALTGLCLNQIPLEEEGSVIIADALQANTSMRYLSLMRGNIPSECGLLIAKSARKAGIVYLNLAANLISLETALQILEALRGVEVHLDSQLKGTSVSNWAYRTGWNPLSREPL